MEYKRADTTWMAESKFGVSAHWTTQSMPTRGAPRPFKEAVENFDVGRFVGQIEESGADYLIFTPNHAEYFFPGPVKEIQETLPGRAMERDLVGEIAGALKSRGKRFMLYYNLLSDREWETAMGYYHPSSFEPFIASLCRVVGGISRRYAGLLDGWWFDCGYCVDTTAEEVRVKAPSLEGRQFRFPWGRLAAAAKQGGENILVSYSPGANVDEFIYTDHQDYWHGERGYFQGERNTRVPLRDICLAPTGRWRPDGLQWHQWTCLDNREWVHRRQDCPAADPLYTEEEVFDFVKLCDARKAAITFNVEVFQEGLISAKAVDFLGGLRRRL